MIFHQWVNVSFILFSGHLSALTVVCFLHSAVPHEENSQNGDSVSERLRGGCGED